MGPLAHGLVQTGHLERGMGMRPEWAATLKQMPKRYRLRVRERLVILEYATTRGIKPAAARFGLNCKTVRHWRDRWKAAGVEGLIPRYPKRRARPVSGNLCERIRHAREELHYGSTRTQLWLWRRHRLRLSPSTILRVGRALGLAPLQRVRKRRPRQLKLFERERPGECVQVDVKFVRVGRRHVFQYTALDDCTRYRLLRLYPHLNHWNSLEFFQEVRRVLPFPIQRLQTDNGPEFPLAFRLSVEEAGIECRYSRPRRPQQNGKVERSHRIDSEEFWSRHTFSTFTTASLALRPWEERYNHDRFSIALKGRTPAERLADFRAAA
jgi:transposase InsO family protein